MPGTRSTTTELNFSISVSELFYDEDDRLQTVATIYRNGHQQWTNLSDDDDDSFHTTLSQ